MKLKCLNIIINIAIPKTQTKKIIIGKVAIIDCIFNLNFTNKTSIISEEPNPIKPISNPQKDPYTIKYKNALKLYGKFILGILCSF
jgi:hypothetical protein